MGGTGKKDKPVKPADEKGKKPPPPADWDELYEDGDIASPKRDRYGPDEEPY